MSKKRRPYDADPEPSRCKSCNMPYIEHMGIQGTCAKLQEALSTLKSIRTWASFEGGVDLDAEHLVKLCDKVLEGTTWSEPAASCVSEEHLPKGKL